MGPATETADPRRDSPLRRVATAPTREEAAAAEGPTPLRTRQCFSSVLSRSSAQLIPKTEPRAQTACRLNSRCPRAPEADDNNDSLLLLPESRRPKTTRRSRRHFPNAGSHDPRYSPSHWLRTAEKGDVTSRARLPPPPKAGSVFLSSGWRLEGKRGSGKEKEIALSPNTNVHVYKLRVTHSMLGCVL